jgi:hypothetical protein
MMPLIVPERPTYEQYAEALGTIARHGRDGHVVEPRQWVIAHQIRDRYASQNPHPHLRVVDAPSES